jgi:hypothetical protein
MNVTSLRQYQLNSSLSLKDSPGIIMSMRDIEQLFVPILGESKFLWPSKTDQVSNQSTKCLSNAAFRNKIVS